YFRSSRGITLLRASPIRRSSDLMCGALLPTVSGGTASLPGSATAAPGVDRVPGGPARAVPGVPGFRSARGITLQRGAGVFPPTAYMCDALLPTVSGGTASPSGSATAAPGVDRVPGGPARAVPGVPGFRSARGITPHRGAAVLPPAAYTYDAFVPTVSGGTASPRR